MSFENTIKCLNECDEALKSGQYIRDMKAAELCYWCEQYIRDYEIWCEE